VTADDELPRFFESRCRDVALESPTGENVARRRSWLKLFFVPKPLLRLRARQELTTVCRGPSFSDLDVVRRRHGLGDGTVLCGYHRANQFVRRPESYSLSGSDQSHRNFT
jgi:hypothetical protein